MAIDKALCGNIDRLQKDIKGRVHLMSCPISLL